MRHTALLMILLLITGCAHTIQMSTSVTPVPGIEITKYPYSVAVLGGENLKALTQQVSPSSIQGSLNYYTFDVGNVLHDALLKSVKRVYEKVDELDHTPRKGAYDRIIIFSVTNSDMDIKFGSGAIRIFASAAYILTVHMAVMDGEASTLPKQFDFSGEDSSKIQKANKNRKIRHCY